MVAVLVEFAETVPAVVVISKSKPHVPAASRSIALQSGDP
jgi:hypothetical protein